MKYINIRKEQFPGSREIDIGGQTYHVKSSGYSKDDEVMQAAERIIANRSPSLKTNKLEIKSW
jgi:hypothetical protein